MTYFGWYFLHNLWPSWINKASPGYCFCIKTTNSRFTSFKPHWKPTSFAMCCRAEIKRKCNVEQILKKGSMTNDMSTECVPHSDLFDTEIIIMFALVNHCTGKWNFNMWDLLNKPISAWNALEELHHTAIRDISNGYEEGKVILCLRCFIHFYCSCFVI